MRAECQTKLGIGQLRDSLLVWDSATLLSASTTKEQIVASWPGGTVKGRRKFLKPRLLLGHCCPGSAGHGTLAGQESQVLHVYSCYATRSSSWNVRSPIAKPSLRPELSNTTAREQGIATLRSLPIHHFYRESTSSMNPTRSQHQDASLKHWQCCQLCM